MICRAMKKITNRLIANNVETLAMMATPVVVSLFLFVSKSGALSSAFIQRSPIHPDSQPSVQTPLFVTHDFPFLQ